MKIFFRKIYFFQKLMAALMMVCMIFIMIPQMAHADLPSAPLVMANGAQNGMVRVFLASMGNPSVLTLTIQGSYTVNGKSTMTLAGGSQVTVKFNESTGALTLTRNGVTTNMGNEFKLRRHQASGTSGIRIAQARKPDNLYPGDLHFIVRAKGDKYKLYTIAYVYIEDYLYGVVPYEMGNSAHIEALKAQTISARTYVLRAMTSAVNALYDVDDTTSSQVYNGTSTGYSNCKAAVDATRGIISKNGSDFTGTWYTASNGGQIEAVKNVWGSAQYPYMCVKDDPFDLENPDSRVKSFTVNKSGVQGNSELENLLNRKLVDAFGTGAIINQITAVTPNTPKYPDPSRLYTRLDFTVLYSKNGLQQEGVLSFSIFDELESPLNMSINSAKNELWSVEETAAGFSVKVRRYGHGIGLSQRGAMQMGRLGYTYDQIMAFYFEGCTRVQYTFLNTILSPVVNGADSYEIATEEEPSPLDGDEATSSPTTCTAIVTTQSGTLNLRAGAAKTFDIIRTIPKGTKITILERGDIWCKTTYAGATGYVMTEFLTFENDSTDPPAAPETSSGEKNYIQITSAVARMYSSPVTEATVLKTLSKGDTASVKDYTDRWVYVDHAGTRGYLEVSDIKYLEKLPEPPAAKPDPTPEKPGPEPDEPDPVIDEYAQPVARVVVTGKRLNVRLRPLSNSKVVFRVDNRALVTVLELGTNWCLIEFDGQTGYAQTKYLKILGGDLSLAQPVSVSGETMIKNDDLENHTIVSEPVAGENSGKTESVLSDLSDAHDDTLPAEEPDNSGSSVSSEESDGQSV